MDKFWTIQDNNIHKSIFQANISIIIRIFFLGRKNTFLILLQKIVTQ